jgi:hypothetical protein
MSFGAPAPSGAKTAPEVTIDRLIFDIPGLDRAAASELARKVGERLASAGLSGEHPRIGITLGPIGGSQDELVARIVAALSERLV